MEFRSIYEGVIAGYHMNKKHWNTVFVEDSDVDDESVKELIYHSYELVYKSLTKKKREGKSFLYANTETINYENVSPPSTDTPSD